MAAKKTQRPTRRKIAVPKNCYFCEEKKEPTYMDIPSLQKFTTERGKIMGRVRTGICAKHQRHLTASIKHARYLALMPFLVRD